ncbi:MAG: hypothetical protein E7080_10590 [Bacteroidales bacterium]|nr:hypothetical protein [Bacteroidales bacterium]
MKQNPWLGLATYDETLISKGYKFCGRERAINELYSIIDNNIITTLYGKSGIGKSSLLQAGIFPLCRYNNYLPVMIRLGVGNNSTSASSYIDTVIASVEQCIQANNGSIQKNNDDTSTIRDTEKLWHFFHSSQFRNSNNDVIFPVIVLDQFEELYYRDRDQLNTLLKSIYLLLDDSSINGNSNESQIINYRIVISIREDYLFHLEDSIDKLRLSEIKDNRYHLCEFNEDEAFNVITMPGNDIFDKDEINSIAYLIIRKVKANSTEISSAILSLICCLIFSSVKENRLITLNDVNLFFKKDAQGNFLKSFYEEIQKFLHITQWYYIEDKLVTDEGRRNSVLESEFNKVIPNSQWLFEGVHSMLRKVTIQGSSEPRIEIIHDMLAKQMLSSKNERKLQEQARRLRRQRLTAFAIIAVIVALGVTFYLQYRSIVEERNNMYKMHSRYIAKTAETLIEEGDINTVIRLLLNILPVNLDKPNRPYVEEAVHVLIMADEIYSSSKFQYIRTLNHYDNVTSVSFSPNGKFIVTVSRDNTAKIWNTETGMQVGETLKHNSGVNSASFSPDSKFIVTASKDNMARIWNANTGKQVGETLKHDKYVNSASFSPDGKFIVTASNDNTAKIWNAETGQQVGKTITHDKYVYSAQFSPPIWNAETGKQVGVSLKHDDSVRSASFSPDGKFIITASSDNTVKIWNAETGQQVGKTITHDKYVYSAQFSPNSEFIVTASSDSTAKIWNTKTGKQVGVSLKHDNSVLSASFSPDSKFIVTTSFDNTVKIWNVKTGEQEGKTMNHRDWVRSASFSSDGKYIITASLDHTAKVWNTETTEQIGETLKHDDDVISASFSPDGKYIVTASSDNTAKIWNVDVEKQVFFFQDINFDGRHNITIDEIRKYIESIPMQKILDKQKLIDRYKDLFKDWPLSEEELEEYNFK